MGRPLGILALGLTIAVGIGVALLPAYSMESITFLLILIVIGVVITVVAGFKGRKADEERELARQSRLLTQQPPDEEA